MMMMMMIMMMMIMMMMMMIAEIWSPPSRLVPLCASQLPFGQVLAQVGQSSCRPAAKSLVMACLKVSSMETHPFDRNGRSQHLEASSLPCFLKTIVHAMCENDSR